MKKPLPIIALLTAFIFVSGCFNVFRKADTDVSKKIADFELSAKALVENFEMNEDSANIQFLDKVVQVEGNVNTISEKEEAITVYLKENEDLAGVLCGFNPGSINIQSLQVGDIIKVKGICTGYLLDVVLAKCSIVEE